MNRFHLLLTAGLATGLLAQAPTPVPAPAFQGDLKVLMAACADKARSLDPKDSRLLAEYGRAYLVAGLLDKAQGAFKAAIASDPKDGETHRLVGIGWLAGGKREEALLAFEGILTAAPRSRNVIKHAALNLLEAGFPNEARRFMEASWLLDPTDYHNGKDFATAALQAHQWELASAWMERVAPLDKDWKDQLEFARQALRLGQRDLGLRWLERAAQIKPKEARLWNEVALILSEVENPTWPAHP